MGENQKYWATFSGQVATKERAPREGIRFQRRTVGTRGLPERAGDPRVARRVRGNPEAEGLPGNSFLPATDLSKTLLHERLRLSPGEGCVTSITQSIGGQTQDTIAASFVGNSTQSATTTNAATVRPGTDTFLPVPELAPRLTENPTLSNENGRPWWTIFELSGARNNAFGCPPVCG
jgi:hypothetical protein